MIEFVVYTFTSIYLLKFFIYFATLNIISSTIITPIMLVLTVAKISPEEISKITAASKVIKFSIAANNSKFIRCLNHLSVLIPFHDVITNYIVVREFARTGNTNGFALGILKSNNMNFIPLKIPCIVVKSKE